MKSDMKEDDFLKFVEAIKNLDIRHLMDAVDPVEYKKLCNELGIKSIREEVKRWNDFIRGEDNE